MTQKKNFDEISNRLLNLNPDVLSQLSEKLSNGDIISPQTEEEKHCYQVIRDLDYIEGFVQGSTTSKKYMRNEIWSLIAALGAPAWYITLAFADNRHPIAIYFADTKEWFKSELKLKDDEKV